jgi:hypothetical protein
MSAEQPGPISFEEFWPYYVSQHLDARCRRMHFAGIIMALGCLAASPVFPPALLAAPVIGYGMSWIGHFAFEHNRPASWSSMRHFAWSFRSDLRMFRYILAGRMAGEVERATVQSVDLRSGSEAHQTYTGDGVAGP